MLPIKDFFNIFENKILEGDLQDEEIMDGQKDQLN